MNTKLKIRRVYTPAELSRLSNKELIAAHDRLDLAISAITTELIDAGFGFTNYDTMRKEAHNFPIFARRCALADEAIDMRIEAEMRTGKDGFYKLRYCAPGYRRIRK